MSGRIENEIKIDSIIEDKLNHCPFYVKEWMRWLLATDKSAATRKDYLNKIIHFLSFIKRDIINISLEEITREVVVDYFAALRTVDNNGIQKYSSDSYKQTVWSCLNSFFNYLKGIGYIQNNYIESIPRPQNKDLQRINHNRVVLTTEDFEKILKCVRSGVGSSKAKKYQSKMRSRDICIMMLFMSTGMRKTALMEINLEDIDYEKRTLTIIDKGDKEHQYVLNDELYNALEDWLIEREYLFPTSDALFITKDGERISGNGIDKIVKKYTQEAIGIPLSPHKLRAGLCTILYDIKKDAEFVRRAIGHSNISTTLRYIVTENKEKEETANIMNEIFSH